MSNAKLQRKSVDQDQANFQCRARSWLIAVSLDNSVGGAPSPVLHHSTKPLATSYKTRRLLRPTSERVVYKGRCRLFGRARMLFLLIIIYLAMVTACYIEGRPRFFTIFMMSIFWTAMFAAYAYLAGPAEGRPLPDSGQTTAPGTYNMEPVIAMFNRLSAFNFPRIDPKPALQGNNQVPLVKESGSRLELGQAPIVWAGNSQMPVVTLNSPAIRLRPNVTFHEHDYFDRIDGGKWLVSHDDSSIPRGDKLSCELLEASVRTSLFWGIVSLFPDIVERLCSPGVDSTVFVPSDHAMRHFHRPFDRLPRSILKAFVEYHISPQVVPVSKLVETHTVGTLLQKAESDLPERISTQFMGERLSLNLDATLDTPGSNVVAQNGLIHMIDKPLSPPPQFEILISQMKKLSIFKRLLDETRISDDIKRQKSNARRTIFAFTDSALDGLLPTHKEYLLSSFGVGRAIELLKKHMIDGALYSDGYYVDGQPAIISKSGLSEIKAPDLNTGRNRTISINREVDDDGKYRSTTMKIDGSANVVVPNLIFDGGVLHIVDSIIMGPKKKHSGFPWVFSELWDEMARVYDT